MTVEKQTGGSLITFSPTLDASALLNFARSPRRSPDISPELLNNALHFWFDGTNPSVKSQRTNSRSSPAPCTTNGYDPTQDFTATAGQCVSSADVDASASDGVTGVVRHDRQWASGRRMWTRCTKLPSSLHKFVTGPFGFHTDPHGSGHSPPPSPAC